MLWTTDVYGVDVSLYLKVKARQENCPWNALDLEIWSCSSYADNMWPSWCPQGLAQSSTRGCGRFGLDYDMTIFKKILKHIDGNIFSGVFHWGLSHISTQTMSCAPTHSTDHTHPESEIRPVMPDVMSVIRSICVDCIEGRVVAAFPTLLPFKTRCLCISFHSPALFLKLLNLKENPLVHLTNFLKNLNSAHWILN